MASIHPPKPSSGGISGSTIIIVIVAGVLLILGGVLIGTLTPQLFPPPASAEAKPVDDLFHISLVIGGAIFLLVQGMLVFSIIRFRAKPGDTSDGAYIHGSTTLEIVWTAIPAVIVVVLTILSWQVFDTIFTPKPDEAKVFAAGARFNWAFTYDVPLSIMPEQVDLTKLPEDVRADVEADGLLSVTSPILYTYVGQPVVMEMEPKDVIHAFWIPAFRLKQDLIPGRTTSIRFTPTIAGTYPIECAELCGANHGLMRSEVVVLDNEQGFNQMMVPMMDEKIHPPADPVLRGRKILSSNVYPCYTCHVLSDLTEAPQPWAGNVGPALNGIADRVASSRASATGQTPAEYLYTAVHEPSAYLVPGYGALMPQLNIPECDAWAIVAYLATQSESGSAPFEVTQPAQCVITDTGAAAPSSEATVEAAPTGEATVEPTPAS
ncbi:MAG: cytochrome c oxidase subunit II [Anaerolineae bacterium]